MLNHFFPFQTVDDVTLDEGPGILLQNSEVKSWILNCGLHYRHNVVNAAFLFFETSKLWALIMYIL